MTQFRKALKNQKGLTLVELLAVIVILGIIAAIAVPAVANIIENSRKDAHVANAESLYNAARLAVVSENLNAEVDSEWTFFADNSTANREDQEINLIEDRYLDSAPQDPESDGVYTDAEVTYDGTDYTIKLDDYFGTDGDGETITIIRSLGRDAVVE